jgi:hypothetical protein
MSLYCGSSRYEDSSAATLVKISSCVKACTCDRRRTVRRGRVAGGKVVAGQADTLAVSQAPGRHSSHISRAKPGRRRQCAGILKIGRPRGCCRNGLCARPEQIAQITLAGPGCGRFPAVVLFINAKRFRNVPVICCYSSRKPEQILGPAPVAALVCLPSHESHP